ncbi:MAG: hypothetical protein ACTSQH_00015 [Candidatus Hodarchaeales archaeon]
MKDHIKIRQEHVRLVRAGKHDKAQKLLEIIWDRKKVNVVEPVVEEKPGKVETKVKVKTEESKFSSLNDLVLIKGIGKKTIKDIVTMFVDLEELKTALILDKVALRDDIVKKLKEELLI